MMDFFLKHRRALAGVLGVLTLVFVWCIQYLGFSFSFDSFYPQSDPDFRYYKEYQKMFHEDESFMIALALKSPSGSVFDAQFLQQADSLFEQISQQKGLDSAVFGTRLPYLRRRGLSVSTKPYLRFDSPEAVERSRKRIQKDSILYNGFLSQDEEYLCAYFFIQPEIIDAPLRDSLNTRLDKMLQQSDFDYVVSGISYIRTQYVRKITREFALFLGISLLLIILILWLTYRNIWGVMIPAAAVSLSIAWLLGFMGMTNQPINLITNLLAPIMFVVGTSDVIHLMTNYIHGLREGKSKQEAMRHTLHEIGLATFLTSATTAIGFASLMVSKVPPIRSFGLYAAIGVFATYFISIIIIPNTLTLIPTEKLLQKKNVESLRIWRKIMWWFYRVTKDYAKSISVLATVLILACLGLITQISLNIYLLEDVGKNDPIRVSMNFFEEEFSGLRPFEVAITAKEGHKVTERALLLEMDRIQNHLKQEFPVFKNFMSAASFVKGANYLYHNNRDKHMRIPDTQDEVEELLAFVEASGDGVLDRVVNEDETIGRLSARIPDRGATYMADVYEELDSLVTYASDTSLFEYQITGTALLTENNMKYIRKSLMSGLLIAFVVIGGILGLLFRSWKMLFIGMIPNLIPLLMLGGVMGLFGIKLTASTAIIFIISFGVAVDDTIHFLTRYRIERQEGKGKDVAIRNTLLGTGKAMIITSLVLMGGFIMLLFSDFGGTFYIGLFTGLTIFFALLADFFLLPILLRVFEK